MFLELFTLFIASILLSLGLILLIKKIFFKLNILDNPEKYNLKRKAIPYSMWIVFFIWFFILSYFSIFSNLLWENPELTSKLFLLWWFWFLITVVSFLDDLLNVSPKIRLLMQIIIWAIIWITSIKIGYISNIFNWIFDLFGNDKTIDLHIYSTNFFGLEIFLIPLIFTIIWYVFIFNAINWSDGIRGNTTGLSIISFGVLFLLWIILFNWDEYTWGVENAYFVMKISLILVWLILPFWYFDIKNKLLMWDSGTMFLGFMLASLAIIAWGKIATVLVVFGIYSVDAIYVILKRLQNKKSPMTWDFTHLHHRLLKVWFTEKQVLTFVYSLSLIFWISALFLDKVWKIIVFILIIVIVVFINRIKLVKFKK